MKDFSKLTPGDYLAIFWRRRWYFVVTAVLVTGAATYYAWHMPKVYMSETTIMIESLPIPEEYVRSAVRQTAEDRINLIKQQLQSRTLLQRMIEELRLYGFGTADRFSMDSAILRMQNSLSVSAGSRSSVTIAYYSEDPLLARDITKRLAEEVIHLNTASRETKAIETDRFIDEQFRQVERDLAAHEAKLRDFKVANLGALPEQASINMAAVSALNTQLAASENALQRAKDQYSLLEHSLREQNRLRVLMKDLSPRQTAPSGPAREDSGLSTQLNAKRAQLATIMARYTAKHPEVERLTREIQDLEKKISQAAPEQAAGAIPETQPPSSSQSARSDDLISLDAAEIKAEMASVKREINTREKERLATLEQIRIHQARINLAPKLEHELLTLTRQHEALKQQYGNLQAKKFSTQMTASLEKDMKSDTFKIIDKANLPEKPIGGSRRSVALMGLLAGLVLGVAAVLAREYFDATISDEAQISNELSLMTLILIPEISKKEIQTPTSPDSKSRKAAQILPF